MSPDGERFMAFLGLIQWTECVSDQSKSLYAATARRDSHPKGPKEMQSALLHFQSQAHLFAIAANKLIEHMNWCRTLGLFGEVDFAEIDAFPAADIKDLRDMREHVVDYFTGLGRVPTRWFVTTALGTADASSVTGTLLGGRLDWVAFAGAAERLLPHLHRQPIPYPEPA
jgi:hypothetical protein